MGARDTNAVAGRTQSGAPFIETSVGAERAASPTRGRGLFAVLRRGAKVSE